MSLMALYDSFALSGMLDPSGLSDWLTASRDICTACTCGGGAMYSYSTSAGSSALVPETDRLW